MDYASLLILMQLFSCVVITLYFISLYRREKAPKSNSIKSFGREMSELARMRARALSEPLSEKTRPRCFEDIIGQSEGIKALKAAICGPNPQHVLIYGPPGIGKTCAARLVLEAAKADPESPFNADSKFIEMDATCIRFDERSIADPLLGSVHDPIYQGAGALGSAGIPQPKPGAVTKAHCGILFLDEIGEMHPTQLNKLLKVLEDRKVFFESAYYSRDDTSIPQYIHSVFQNGLPADFRLIGATTAQQNDIPPALRSRCLEIFFRPLSRDELEQVAQGAARRGGFEIEKEAAALSAQYAQSGRDTVNMIQLSGGVAHNEGRLLIEKKDIEWVASTCHYKLRPQRNLSDETQVGVANGLAVSQSGEGILMEIEAIAIPCVSGGKLTITGMVEEEELGSNEHKLKRKSTAIGSVENVISVLRKQLSIDTNKFDIHLNLPGGMPVDGPSAGVTIAVAIVSAITGTSPRSRLALTGELSLRGLVKPVGGVKAKAEAAISAGAQLVLIPEENWQDSFACMRQVVPVKTLQQVLELAFTRTKVEHVPAITENGDTQILSATSSL
jgi:Lon-like ATP-dependent protease